ncbi:MAG: hypothetical protein U9R42_10980 [Bacteroidota bacterium]|nr:hypothetical protein [Bacteroidota bacterium]
MSININDMLNKMTNSHSLLLCFSNEKNGRMEEWKNGRMTL